MELGGNGAPTGVEPVTNGFYIEVTEGFNINQVIILKIRPSS